MKKKLLAVLIPLGIVIVLLAGFYLSTGGKCGAVYMTDFTVTEDGSVIVLEAGVAASAGYLRTAETRADGNILKVTFYRTFGINNPIGSWNLFPLDLPENCNEIHIWRDDGEFVKILEKNTDGEWVESE